MTYYITEYQTLREKQKTLLTTGFTPATWVKETPYPYNSLVKPTVTTTNKNYYRCILAGTSAATEPAWPTTFWGEKTDGTAKWRQENPVYILDAEPVGYSYPCVIVGDIGSVDEIQMAMGNVPANELRTAISVLAYQKGKTWQQTRLESFDVLRQVQNIIRSYPNLSAMANVISAKSGIYTIDNDTVPVIYRLNLLWFIKTYSRGG